MCLLCENTKKFIFKSMETSPTVYFSFFNKSAKIIIDGGKSVVFIGNNFCVGLFLEANSVDL